jgi:hypothetical protein
MASLIPTPLPIAPTRNEIADALGCDRQTVARNKALVRIPTPSRESQYDNESVEKYFESIGRKVIWVDRRTGRIFDPAVGLVTA